MALRRVFTGVDVLDCSFFIATEFIQYFLFIDIVSHIISSALFVTRRVFKYIQSKTTQ